MSESFKSALEAAKEHLDNLRETSIKLRKELDFCMQQKNNQSISAEYREVWSERASEYAEALKKNIAQERELYEMLMKDVG